MTSTVNSADIENNRCPACGMNLGAMVARPV